MSVVLFPDNTVLINFVIISRVDLLERLANGNGRWCASVASECARSSRQPRLAALAEMAGIFGGPLFPDEAEHRDMLVLRAELAEPGDPKHKHLGEAETLAIMLRRRINGFFVTDDREARRLTAKNGIRAVSTWDLLRVAHKQGWVDSDTLWGYVQTLRTAQRGSPPRVHDRASMEKWLFA
ncbi:hypothetical protein MU582_05005 [Nocardioidaceae bacterium SCSIO 66511]|nr:hypothetical protein MU582_05005 [Nocardioidaceae bacterium SCSIO 66511]